MFVLLNGSFGIGKSTVADLLVGRVANARLYDPERAGHVLRRLPAFLLGRTQQPVDYQDLAQWRWLTQRGCVWSHRSASAVVVPMAFTNLGYFEDLQLYLGRVAPVLPLCLVAPIAVVEQRLQRRAAAEGRAVTEFETRRSRECCVAHADPRFGRPVDATRAPTLIVGQIASLIDP